MRSTARTTCMQRSSGVALPRGRPSASLHNRLASRPRGDLAQRPSVQAAAQQVSSDHLSTQSGVPVGTPSRNVCKQDLNDRPRRNRKHATFREAIRETAPILPANLIYPLFVYDHEAEPDTEVEIASMPGVVRHTVDGLVAEVGEAMKYGVKQVVIFPKTPDALKTRLGEESANPEGLAQRTIRALKQAYGDEVFVHTDVALDPYNTDGHDGIVDDTVGRVLNDETVSMLCAQAVSQAEAGADCVAPSDMMDGRIGRIREALDEAGFEHVSIMSYCAKYASAFYGPFRDALDSAPAAGGKERKVPKDKKTYQMDPGNFREALRELEADEAEGADVVMVKPGMPYLDVIRLLKDNSNLPVAAYHVSGEYAMLKAAAQNGWVDERECALEALTCFKRAGADLILTYYAKQAAMWLQEE
mmetsp:Transcript_11093/g.23211  ORF Transcript_11093/g.23211 Transcript_11093/m.23211 type:complete len:416 (+) Transcript_11093:178-1425(+)|eukprot:CAMPEP_0197488164 /NCGR_PEP_ID=MMETSP1311-20131121/3140_1 /TAXON_ID=464262 /ORGANISM="Genus nov. species nov., Strain RCC856" /LENGTH=415 /DNA_ID=CAMNT_0043032111 /DNA_START=76 /DNA_END=1323 /DNA_ORIENTATION=+